MRWFIAGAASTGPSSASAASVRTLSARPCASFASVFALRGRDHEQVGALEVRVRAAGRRPTRECGERLGGDEAFRPRRQHRHDLAPGADEQRQSSHAL
jgi:hypothetical protein